MFTGIVTDVGRVVETKVTGDLRARIATRYDVDGIDIGASIACDGVCLTVVDVLDGGEFSADVMHETLQRSSLALRMKSAGVVDACANRL